MLAFLPCWLCKRAHGLHFRIIYNFLRSTDNEWDTWLACRRRDETSRAFNAFSLIVMRFLSHSPPPPPPPRVLLLARAHFSRVPRKSFARILRVFPRIISFCPIVFLFRVPLLLISAHTELSKRSLVRRNTTRARRLFGRMLSNYRLIYMYVRNARLY